MLLYAVFVLRGLTSSSPEINEDALIQITEVEDADAVAVAVGIIEDVAAAEAGVTERIPRMDHQLCVFTVTKLVTLKENVDRKNGTYRMDVYVTPFQKRIMYQKPLRHKNKTDKKAFCTVLFPVIL